VSYLRRFVSRFPWQRRVTKNFWGNASDAVFSVILLGVGFVLLTWFAVGLVIAGRDMALVALATRIVGILFSGSVALIGTFRLIRVLYVNSGSPEHRSQFLQQAFDLEYLRPFETAQSATPTVPQLAPGQIGHGQRLKFRLLSRDLSRGRLGGLAVFSIVMLGVCTVLVAVIWDQWNQMGLQRLSLTLGFLVVLAVVTGWLLRKTGRHLVTQIQLGPTILELSQHPLLPGGDYQFFFQQFGEIQLERLEVVLECVEQSTYRQGTDMCTHQHTAYSEVLAELNDVQLADPGAYLEVDFQLPAAAMHSFSSSNNRIGWRFVVKGAKPGCLEFKREFPILVLPRLGAQLSTAT